ncbi:PstS family phosphate ABC transporter substrate-binding protein [Flavisolibacter nicotianae]|uniref:PstS family phosphate ABC transporter substrate-binding protein n=1 Tax=Flavisolibacter nicotianae TaxID=2364882 RepID=UPI000EB05265|nr:substrate-binding domain-containing protein [Flavisolibacter nicotianae]
MKWTGRLVLAVLGFLSFSHCSNHTGLPARSRFDSGTVYISCDESFKPVLEAELQVFRGDYPKANVVVQYKPEADCLRDFLVDSIEMVIATRPYSQKEKRLIADSLNVATDYSTVAYDAIAVLVHPQSADSMFTLGDVRNLLTGKSKKNLIPVLDGLKATSTVRFMLDSVLRGEPLGKNVSAAPNSKEVIDYVARTPNAVGFVGIEWVGNADDTAQLNLLKKVRLARMESTDSVGGFVLPVQYLIYTRTYPLIRSLVYVLKEKEQGLAGSFANFLRNDRGQLIFRRAYLFPALRPFYMRDAQTQ